LRDEEATTLVDEKDAVLLNLGDAAQIFVEELVHIHLLVILEDLFY